MAMNTSRADRGLPVWLPWVLAPGFLFLPLAGCGIATTLRRPALATARGAVHARGGAAAMEAVATVVPPRGADPRPTLASLTGAH